MRLYIYICGLSRHDSQLTEVFSYGDSRDKNAGAKLETEQPNRCRNQDVVIASSVFLMRRLPNPPCPARSASRKVSDQGCQDGDVSHL